MLTHASSAPPSPSRSRKKRPLASAAREGGSTCWTSRRTTTRGEQYAALVTIRENESRVIAPDGSVDGEVDYKQDVQLEMLLTWNGTSWVVDGVDVKYANKL